MKRIELSTGGFTKVDDDDYDFYSHFTWWSDRKGYVVREEDDKTVRLHRLITGCPRGLQVDHKNGDKRDNQQSNLRICTGSQNQHNRGNYASNRSGLKGVGWQKNCAKWRARIQVNGKQINLGSFQNKMDAFSAYKKAAHELHGEFARY